MIARTGKGNFIVQHYDWVVAGGGALALVGALAVCLLGGSAEEEISSIVGTVSSSERATVAAVDMGGYAAASNAVHTGRRYEFVTKKAATFFATVETRVICTNCAKATPVKADEDGNKFCVFCAKPIEGEKKIEVDKVRVAWIKRYGLNLDDASVAAADADGDDFTNAEEYDAKTDPLDKASHPDYLDGLKIQLPLRETYLPFVFISANKIPTGWRCSFFDPKLKDDYGRAGRVLTALLGDEIGTSGFVLKTYEPKEESRAISGGQGMTKKVDVSEVTVERKSDHKTVKLVLAANKRAKPASVDVRATLVYERRGSKSFDVLTGSEIVLSGTTYRVDSIASDGAGAKVVVQNVRTGQKRMIHAK